MNLILDEQLNKMGLDGKFSYLDYGNKATKRFHALVKSIVFSYNLDVKCKQKKILVEKTTPQQLIDKYHSLLLETFGDKLDSVFQNPKIREEVLDAFPNLTPEILLQIQAQHQ
jgi:hypothetical protein